MTIQYSVKVNWMDGAIHQSYWTDCRYIIMVEILKNQVFRISLLPGSRRSGQFPSISG
jgi:hypothetical protein